MSEEIIVDVLNRLKKLEQDNVELDQELTQLDNWTHEQIGILEREIAELQGYNENFREDITVILSEHEERIEKLERHYNLVTTFNDRIRKQRRDIAELKEQLDYINKKHNIDQNYNLEKQHIQQEVLRNHLKWHVFPDKAPCIAEQEIMLEGGEKSSATIEGLGGTTEITLHDRSDSSPPCKECGEPMNQHVGTGREWICPEKEKLPTYEEEELTIEEAIHLGKAIRDCELGNFVENLEEKPPEQDEDGKFLKMEKGEENPQSDSEKMMAKGKSREIVVSKEDLERMWELIGLLNSYIDHHTNDFEGDDFYTELRNILKRYLEG